VAEAALEAAQGQLTRTEQERARLAEQLDALGDGGEQSTARDQAEQRAKTAAQALADADSRRVEAEQGRASAADRRDAAESALAAAGRPSLPPAPNMTRSPARSTMAAEQRSPACPPSRDMSEPSPQRSARMSMQQSVAMRRAAGREAAHCRTIRPWRPG
jgi:hypothetical protein